MERSIIGKLDGNLAVSSAAAAADDDGRRDAFWDVPY